MSTETAGVRAASSSSPSRARMVLLACILSSSLVGMDSMMTSVALPAIADDLGADLAVQQWVVAGFLLALGSLLLVGGALGDILDRWRVFAVGTGAFGAAALISALAPTSTILIVGRLAQGAGAALMVPGALAVITNTFSDTERSRAISSWAAWSGLSVVAGPLIGGLLVEEASWRLTYGLLAASSALVVVLIVRVTPGRQPQATRASIDWRGALLGIPLVGGPVFALIQGPGMGWGHPAIAMGVAVGLAAAAAFVWWERRVDRPLLPLDLFRHRAFSALNLVTFVLYSGLIASGVYTVLFLQQTAGYGATTAGLASATPVFVLILLARPMNPLTDRFPAHLLVGVGSLIAGGGILLLLRTDADADFASVVLPSVLIHGIGLTIVVAPLTAGVLATVGEDHAGIASGINNAVARLGSLVGVAVIGVLVAARFSSAVGGNTGGLPLDASARRAVDEARDLPLSVAPPDEVTGTSREFVADALTDASVDAFRVGMAVIGGLAIVAGIIALVGARERRDPVGARGCPGGTLVGAHQGIRPAPQPSR